VPFVFVQGSIRIASASVVRSRWCSSGCERIALPEKLIGCANRVWVLTKLIIRQVSSKGTRHRHACCLHRASILGSGRSSAFVPRRYCLSLNPQASVLAPESPCMRGRKANENSTSARQFSVVPGGSGSSRDRAALVSASARSRQLEVSGSVVWSAVLPFLIPQETVHIESQQERTSLPRG
jgi:hypothetical protein